MAIRGVLFDFDGVIADTENHHVAAWERTLSTLGWEFPPEWVARAAEIDDREFLAELFAQRSIVAGDIEGWVKRKQELMIGMLTDSPRVYPGVPELVSELNGRGLRLGIVSTTWKANVRVVLEASGLETSFRAVIGKDDVTVPKPDPEGYRLALRQLAVPARNVVAIEDSPTGLSAARSANINVVAVGHRRSSGDWLAGAPYLADLRDTELALRVLGI
jgi:HAD superfamily hydrolase (TIGR01509 family)